MANGSQVFSFGLNLVRSAELSSTLRFWAGSLIEFLCTYGSLALYHGPWPLVYMRRVVGVCVSWAG